MSSNAKAFKNMPPEQAQVTAAKPARVQVLKPVPAKEPMPGLSPQVQELIGEFESVCRRVPSLVNEFREALLRRHSLTDVPNQDEEMSDVLAPIVEDLIWTAVPDEWIESAKTRLLNEERRKCALPIQFVAAIAGVFS